MPRKDKPAMPPPDRFGTLREFIDEKLAPMTRGSPATSIVWFVLWAWTDAKTSLVCGASVMRLARSTGLAENTVRAAIKRLLALKALTIAEPGRGRVPVYRFAHLPLNKKTPSTTEGQTRNR